MRIVENGINEDQLENYLNTLGLALDQIHNNRYDGLHFEHIYRVVYYLANRNRSKEAYEILQNKIEHFAHLKLENCVESSNENSELFINRINECFEDISKCLRSTQSVFLYLEKSYLGPSKLIGVEKLYDGECIKFFNSNDNFQSKIQQSIITLTMDIRTLKNPIEIDNKKLLVSKILHHLNKLIGGDGFDLIKDIENQLKNLIYDFYKKKINLQPDSKDYSMEFEKIISSIEYERNLTNGLNLTDRIFKFVGEFHCQYLLDLFMLNTDNQIDTYIIDRKFELLHKIMGYSIEFKVNFDPVIDYLGAFMLRDGKNKLSQIIDSTKNLSESMLSTQYMNVCIEFVSYYHRVIEPFRESSELINVFNRSVIDVVNTSPYFPKYFCIYIHQTIIKKQYVIEEYHSIVIEFEQFFKFIKNKELFKCFYRDYLIERMINNSPQKILIEKRILVILQEYCGALYVSSLVAIIDDFALSKIQAIDFNDWLKDNSHRILFKYHVDILNKKYCPVESTPSAILPQQCSNFSNLLKNYYLENKPNRKLEISPYLGDALLTIKFPATEELKIPRRCYNISMSTTCMIVFMLFSKKNTYTVKKIKESTKLPMETIKAVLYSFAISNRNPHLLITTTPENTYAEVTTYTLNQNFNHEQTNIIIETVVPYEVTELMDKKHMELTLDSQAQQIQYTIVKIMKQEKQLHHDHLLQKVKELLDNRFDVSYEVFKVQINRLIDSEYIRRTSATTPFYEYI